MTKTDVIGLLCHRGKEEQTDGKYKGKLLWRVFANRIRGFYNFIIAEITDFYLINE